VRWLETFFVVDSQHLVLPSKLHCMLGRGSVPGQERLERRITSALLVCFGKAVARKAPTSDIWESTFPLDFF
jgi:hypothetical protein